MPRKGTDSTGRTSVIIDKDLYDEASVILQEVGLGVATAISLYLAEAARFEMLPDLEKNQTTNACVQDSKKIVRIGINLSVEQREKIKKLVEGRGVTVSKVVTNFLQYIVNKKRIPITLTTEKEHAKAYYRRERIEYYTVSLDDDQNEEI